MPTGSFTLPPLRGFVPYGELDVLYDLMRASMTLEVPMWEGSDRPFCRSINAPGGLGRWVRPNPLDVVEPQWNTDAIQNQAGAPHSGHIGQAVYAEDGLNFGGAGWIFPFVFWPPQSPYYEFRNHSILMVGTPMCRMNPELAGVARGNSWRTLWGFVNDALTMIQTLDLNYATDQIRWKQTGKGTSIASPAIPYYGERVAMLFVSGDEGEVAVSPRVFIAREGGGSVDRADFSSPPGMLISFTRHLYLFGPTGLVKDAYSAGGCWEYFAVFLRAFGEEDACAICRDAVGAVKWDPYVVRRVGWMPRVIGQVSAMPGVYGRVSAAPGGYGRISAEPGIRARVSASPGVSARVSAETATYPRISASPGLSSRVSAEPGIYSRVTATPGASPRVSAEPTTYPRVSASYRATGARVSATPNTYPRISARIRIAGEEVFDVQATPLCPSELNWDADNVLELADVMDDMPDPPTEITSANAVTCEIYDRATGLELTAVSPVTLNQVGSTNKWRESVLANGANGFSENQRLRLVYLFDGGAGKQGRFVALSVVPSATS